MKVGLFFKVGERILMDAVPLGEAERYGKALGSGGHYEYWMQLKPATDLEWEFKNGPYDRFPRGRVIYFSEQGRFVIYGDKCLSRRELVAIAELFDVPESEAKFCRDEHYQCAKCNHRFLS